jgi:hypothetical protein
VDWSTPHYETKVGGAILVRDVKSQKKPYYAPSFEVMEIKTAKTKLEAEVTSTGEARQMLSLIDKRQKAYSLSAESPVGTHWHETNR